MTSGFRALQLLYGADEEFGLVARALLQVKAKRPALFGRGDDGVGGAFHAAKHDAGMINGIVL